MERWTVCDAGHVHWGTAGGAGLLFRWIPENGEPTYLLQLRSRSVDEGRTWGIPGGAIRNGESAEDTARRETKEEVGAVPAYRVARTDVQDCGAGWRFQVFLADVDRPFTAYCVLETDATGWFTRQDMNNLRLHPGFRKWLDSPGGKVAMN
jgi:8-oxo-dGTP diphosphatase